MLVENGSQQNMHTDTTVYSTSHHAQKHTLDKVGYSETFLQFKIV